MSRFDSVVPVMTRGHTIGWSGSLRKQEDAIAINSAYYRNALPAVSALRFLPFGLGGIAITAR